METNDKIIELLMKVKRDGIDNLIEYLIEEGFFESPASTRFHGCYAGGLADHSLGVYELLTGYNASLKFNIEEESIIIATLLHDVCKIGAYLGNCKPYKWNRSQPSGHANLSIERVKQFIELTQLEEKMIFYHMGVYGLTEFDENKGEYPLRGGAMANAWNHHPIVKVMYFCDELESFESKAKEIKENNMKILHLTLKKKWFDMILSGEKKQEYREIKQYWKSRLLYKEHDIILFKNGYREDSPSLMIELKGIYRGFGFIKWGALKGEKVFILELGKIIKGENNAKE